MIERLVAISSALASLPLVFSMMPPKLKPDGFEYKRLHLLEVAISCSMWLCAKLRGRGRQFPDEIPSNLGDLAGVVMDKEAIMTFLI